MKRRKILSLISVITCLSLFMSYIGISYADMVETDIPVAEESESGNDIVIPVENEEISSDIIVPAPVKEEVPAEEPVEDIPTPMPVEEPTEEEPAQAVSEDITVSVDNVAMVPMVEDEDEEAVGAIEDDRYFSPYDYYKGYYTNQKGTNWCWLFAGLGAAESNLAKRGLASGIDLSEKYVAYWAYNKDASIAGDYTEIIDKYDEDINTLKDRYNASSAATYNLSAKGYIARGDIMEYLATLLATKYGVTTEGRVSNSDVVYSHSESGFMNASASAPSFSKGEYRLVDYYEIPIENLNRNGIKGIIDAYGAAATSVYVDMSYINAKRNGSFYYSGTPMGGNHTVKLIGWSDNYSVNRFSSLPATPKNNGAWAVANSWGDSNYTSEGQNFVSYEDNGFNHSSNRICVYVMTKQGQEDYCDNVYQYNKDAAGYYGAQKAISNIYVAGEESDSALEVVKAASSWFRNADQNYTLRIYKKVEDGKPESGILAYEGIVRPENPGFSTFVLSEANYKNGGPYLRRGDKYSVVFIADGSMEVPAVEPCDTTSSGVGEYDAENNRIYYYGRTHRVSVNSDRSYFYNGTDWVKNGNDICITAHTNNTDTVVYSPTEISLAKSINGEAGTETSLSDICTYIYDDYNGRIVALNLTSNNNNVVSVTDGKIKFNGLGTATLTASTSTADGKTADVTKTANVKVTASVSGNLVNITWNCNDRYAYTGDAVTFEPVVKYTSPAGSEKTLVKGVDYDLAITNNTAPGTGKATITGKGDFAGTATKTFTIEQRDFSQMSKSSFAVTGLDSSYMRTGSEIRPEPAFAVKLAGSSVATDLDKDTDYTLLYRDNIEAGTAYIALTGKGIYTGTQEFSFKIYRQDISRAPIIKRDDSEIIGISSDNATPDLGISFYKNTWELDEDDCYIYVKAADLVKDVDYRYVDFAPDNSHYYGDTWKQNVKVEGLGNYTGTRTFKVNFREDRKTVQKAMNVQMTAASYKGDAAYPQVSVKDRLTGAVLTDTDYSLTYTGNDAESLTDATFPVTAKVKVAGKGTYSGEQEFGFIIADGRTDINACDIEGINTDGSTVVAFDKTAGKAVPAITIKDGSETLQAGRDYNISFADNTAYGATARMTVSGLKAYKGTRTLSYIVEDPRTDINDASVIKEMSTAGAIWKDNKVKLSIVLKHNGKTLAEGTDYTVSDYSPVKGQTFEYAITGIGDYKGTITGHYAVSNESPSYSIGECTYTGSNVVPEVTAAYDGKTLTEGTDYTVTASGVNAGNGNITISFKTIDTPDVNTTYKINPKNNPWTRISQSGRSFYTGSTTGPEISIYENDRKFTEGTDYDIAYSDNVNAGTCECTITFKGNYSGTASISYVIEERDAADVTVVDIPDQVGTGSEIKPEIKATFNGMTLNSGTDFTAVYSDNINIGQATVTLVFAGNYTGTKTVNFKIVEKQVDPNPVNPDPVNPPAPAPAPAPTPAPAPEPGPVVPEPVQKEGTYAANQKADISSEFSSAGQVDRYIVEPKGAATVTKKGIMTVKKSGTIKVTAQKKSGRTYETVGEITLTAIKPKINKATVTRINKELNGYDMLSEYDGLAVTSWMSSNKKVATIDEKGNITFLKAGSTKITAVFGEGKNAAKYSATLVVKIPRLNKTELKTKTGFETKLKAMNTTLKADWSSDNESVAAVDSDGKVTGKTAGEAVITATIDGAQYSCKVTVAAPAVNKTKMTVKKGRSGKIALKNSKLKTAEWVSSDTSVATVDSNGNITGVNPGTATISTTSYGATGSCIVTVK